MPIALLSQQKYVHIDSITETMHRLRNCLGIDGQHNCDQLREFVYPGVRMEKLLGVWPRADVKSKNSERQLDERNKPLEHADAGNTK